jgi:Rrf2 family iron-sulfur cluster assembly transcriptional regulator
MKLSTKGRYAIRAMINIALNKTNTPTTLLNLARHQNISLSYLEQLFSLLRKNNLVSGIRGPGGGYKLANNPKNITIAQILNAVNEKQGKLIDYQKKDELIWEDFSNKLYKHLDAITLNSLIEGALQTEAAITEESLITEKPLINSVKRHII